MELFKIYKDKSPKVVEKVTEEVTKDSNLELSPAIKNKNFFEEEEIKDFLLKEKPVLITEANQKYIITSRESNYKEVSGTKLNSEFFAHKSDTFLGWCITDTASGLLVVSKLPTLKSFNEFIKGMPEDLKQKIQDARQTERYKDFCAKLPKSLTEDFSKMEDPFEELNKEYEPQMSLFDLL